MKNENIKININVLLDDETNKLVKETNKKVSSVFKSEILFYEQKLVPHITLAMGYLKPNVLLQTIYDKLNCWFENLKLENSILIEPKKVELTPDKFWLMAFLKENQILEKMEVELKKLLSDYVSFKDYGELHITIAKFETECEKDFNFEIPKFKTNKLSVGLVGENGVVKKVLKQFEI